MTVDWKDAFTVMHPGFFEQQQIRDMPAGHVCSELVLDLKTYEPLPPVRVPEGIRFGLWEGDPGPLYEAVGSVVESWVPIYKTIGDPFLCAFENGQPVSFCILENMKSYRGLRIGGPGCVGTVPAARGKAIGLRMVQLATEHFQREGYDYSYIHYTGVDHWYAKLGYQTVLRWTKDGFC